jgi:hypothetical protein
MRLTPQSQLQLIRNNQKRTKLTQAGAQSSQPPARPKLAPNETQEYDSYHGTRTNSQTTKASEKRRVAMRTGAELQTRETRTEGKPAGVLRNTAVTVATEQSEAKKYKCGPARSLLQAEKITSGLRPRPKCRRHKIRARRSRSSRCTEHKRKPVASNKNHEQI